MSLNGSAFYSEQKEGGDGEPSISFVILINYHIFVLYYFKLFLHS